MDFHDFVGESKMKKTMVSILKSTCYSFTVCDLVEKSWKLFDNTVAGRFYQMTIKCVILEMISNRFEARS